MGPDTIGILVVDDEPEDLAAIRALLDGKGYKVFGAGNYDSAWNIFNRSQDEISLLIADVSLPGKNGCELAQSVLSLKPELKVLFVSGHAGAEVCRFYGFTVSDLHFLRKPFQPEALAERVRSVLDAEQGFEALEGGLSKVASHSQETSD
jgi:DNA-binding response OmpR family regulator